MTSFTQHELRLLTDVTGRLSHLTATPLLTDERLAESLIALLKADFIGTTRWDPHLRRYEEPLCCGRDNTMSASYHDYYQFVDPISPKLRRRRRPSSIYEVISRGTLRKSEYYTDFLLANKLSEGMDTYLYDGARIVGDFRIWRRPGAPQFGEREAVLLSALQPHLLNHFRLREAVGHDPASQAFISFEESSGKVRASSPAETLIRRLGDERWMSVLPQIQGASRHRTAPEPVGGLRLAFACDYDSSQREQPTVHLLPGAGCSFSDRERDVLRLVIQGLSDKEIARALDISYWTVRTHVGNAMRKVSARTRGELGYAAQRLGFVATD